MTEAERLRAQQEGVAQLGRRAVKGACVDELADEAVELVSEVANGELAAVVMRNATGDLILSAIAGLASPAEVGTRIDAAGDGLAAHAVRTGDVVVVDDWRTERRFRQPEGSAALGIRSGAVAPIVWRDETLGAVGLHARHANGADPDVVNFLCSIAHVLGAAIASRGANEEIQRLTEHREQLVMQALECEERTLHRVAESLHDFALQELLAARQDLAEARALGGRAAKLMECAEDGLRRAGAELRDAVTELHPVALDHGGLASAIEAIAQRQARRGDIDHALHIDPEIDGADAEFVLWVVRELLLNVGKHANARNVSVKVAHSGNDIHIEVVDDGRGVDPEAVLTAPARGHVGLAWARQRLESLGGALHVEPRADGGTIARAQLPCGARPSR